jgi:hypothetical protein
MKYPDRHPISGPPAVFVTLLVSLVSFFSLVSSVAAEAPATGPLASVRSASGGLLVSASSSTPIVINQMHSWRLHIESAAGLPVTDASVSISGGMPDHDHGLPTAPRMTRNLGSGDYLIEGMKFHMNGRWQVTLAITTSQGQDTAVIELEL